MLLGGKDLEIVTEGAQARTGIKHLGPHTKLKNLRGQIKSFQISNKQRLPGVVSRIAFLFLFCMHF